AIINPVKGQNSPKVGQLALIIASEADLGAILRQNDKIQRYHRRIYMSRMYRVPTETSFYTLVGPILGAPYAAMVAESLIVWGIKKILFLGWCGAVSQMVSIGEVVVPESALIDEGTSPNYSERQDLPAFADSRIVGNIKAELKMRDQHFHSGPVWSTDAVYRETAKKVRHFRAKGALGVEMETAAIFSVSRFRNAAAGAILIVSDELSSLTWRPGFKTPQFREARQRICPITSDLCRDMTDT
ncbi:MAG: nucleoside phosphorylase, partial [Desulfobacteraceae bacterium]